jgi:hypothetical protein
MQCLCGAAVHEAALGESLDKRNFRRKITLQGIVKPTKEWQHTGRKPAQLYRFSQWQRTPMGHTVTLFRPTGEKELALIRDSGWAAFPPRLPDQPTFYPVLNEEYATQIARDWNARDSGAGYVVRFQGDANFHSPGVLDSRRGPRRVQPLFSRTDRTRGVLQAGPLLN